MPSPTETLLRAHDSPEPAQTVLGFDRSMATAPIDCTACLSNTGLKVRPPFTDFQTPPLAEPTKTVRRPSSVMASIAATLPLIMAEPMLRTGSPEMVAESNFTACCANKGEWNRTAATVNRSKLTKTFMGEMSFLQSLTMSEDV